jgi:HK97 family phage major capsid protein
MDYITAPVSILPAGTALSRFMLTLASVGGQQSSMTLEAFASRWEGTPQVSRAFQLETKAAVAPGSTSDQVWAGALVQTGLAKEALDVLRGKSVVAQLAGKAQQVPFFTKVAVDATAAAVGGWVVEGAPMPMESLTFNSIGPLLPMKVGEAVAVTRELVELGGPTAEASIRNTVLGRLAQTIDRLFLDPTIAGGVTPASITNGAIAVTSTGSTPAAIAADLGAMIAAITTAGAALTWIMKPTTAARVAAALGSASDLPRSLYGLPVVLSKNAGAQITLVDLAAIVYADEGAFDVQRTRNAAVQMNTTPDSPPTSATVTTSLYQANLIGLKALRWLNWLRAVDGSVVYMSVAY